ncbi:response regulator transcription factor [Virgibacillus kimchii]
MSLTLDRQMDTLFQNGLKTIKLHEKAVLQEWENIYTHLKNSGRRTADNLQKTITYFSNVLLSEEKEDMEDRLAASRHNTSFQTNQFIITLLENAVHKVIQTNSDHTYHERQAVQYLFSTISDDLLTQPYEQYFSIDSFLKNLVFSNQLPIEWAAVVSKNNDYYMVKKWFNHLNQTSILGNDVLKADTIYALSELLLSRTSEENRRKYNVLPVPHDDFTLLFCSRQEDTSYIMPFITHALQIFQNGKDTFEVTKQEQHWKDSVIMFNEKIIQSRNYHEAVESITAGFVDYLPFERCALFSYSVNEQMSFGLYGHQLDNKAIQSITADMNHLPLIQNNMQLLNFFGKSMDYLQPMYMKNAADGLPDQYVQQFNLRSIVVAPIFLAACNTFLGAAILDQGPGRYFKVTEETFSALKKFGQSAGEILAGYLDEHKKSPGLHLSPREIDVLKLMAEGASTNEAAGKLNLSEYTVRDYVSAIMQKMEARNRTEAVARAIREGLI